MLGCAQQLLVKEGPQALVTLRGDTERGTETQRDRGGQSSGGRQKTEAHREAGRETQRKRGQRLRAETQAGTKKDPQNHRLGGRGAVPSGEPEQRAQASPPPVSHNPHQGRGWPAREPPLKPPAPPPPPPLRCPCAVGSGPTRVPSDFPEAGNREKLFPIQSDPASLTTLRLPQLSQDPRVQAPIPLLPQTLELPGRDKDPRPSPVALRRSGPP